MLAALRNWPWTALAVLVLMTAFLVGAIIIVFQLFDVTRYSGPWLTFSGIALGTLSGGLGIITSRKTGDGELTPWGWVAIYGIAVSFVISGTSMVVDQRRAEHRQKIAFEEIEQAALDLRRVVLRSGGVRLRFQFEMDDLLPGNFGDTLDAQEDRRGIDGGGQTLSHGISSCHSEFPDLKRPDLQDFRKALDDQQVFVALMAASAAEELVASIGDVSESRVIEILESSWTNGNWATVTTRMKLSDQFRDCLSGIEGDWTRAYWNNDEHRFSFQYRLPALVNWRRNSETVRDPDSIPGLALLVVSSALQNVPNSEPITDWHLKRAFLELPDGRVYCGEREDLNLQPIGTSGFGAFSTKLTLSDSWRCD